MAIEFKHVSYLYAAETALAKKGLDDVNFTLQEGRFITLIGHTGSGKSTLLQHFNALLKPTSGEIHLDQWRITPATTNKGLKPLRRKVSLVFQFPESQLFEETVLKDIAFGPKNFGRSVSQANAQAHLWLQKVGLPETVANQSPFDLSGGQMRRVAIAGVMACEPDILCLDEPAAGLDPRGREQMMSLFLDYQKQGHTVILITHNMDDVANYADDVLVMEHGKLIKHGSPKEVFKDRAWLKNHHLDQPTATRFAERLQQKGFEFSCLPLTQAELVAGIKANLGGSTHE